MIFLWLWFGSGVTLLSIFFYLIWSLPIITRLKSLDLRISDFISTPSVSSFLNHLYHPPSLPPPIFIMTHLYHHTSAPPPSRPTPLQPTYHPPVAKLTPQRRPRFPNQDIRPNHEINLTYPRRIRRWNRMSCILTTWI